MAGSLSGQTILVTGATRGIGRAIAAKLLQEGASVIGTGRKDASGRSREDRMLEGVHWHDVDMSNPDQTSRFCRWLNNVPSIDGCINNAGVNRIMPMEQVSTQDYDSVHEVNLRAPYLICQTVAGRMASQGGGKIVNIASIWSEISKPQRSLYSSMKAGLVGLTRAVAVEYGGRGVLVNALSPGFVLTDLTRASLSEEERLALTAQVPLGRMASAEDIADVAAFLVGPSNRYITGQNIVADGGFTIV